MNRIMLFDMKKAGVNPLNARDPLRYFQVSALPHAQPGL